MGCEETKADHGMDGQNEPARPRRRAISVQSGIEDRHTGIVYEETESRFANTRRKLRKKNPAYIIQFNFTGPWHDGIGLGINEPCNPFVASKRFMEEVEVALDEKPMRNILPAESMRLLKLTGPDHRYEVLRTYKIEEE